MRTFWLIAILGLTITSCNKQGAPTVPEPPPIRSEPAAGPAKTTAQEEPRIALSPRAAKQIHSFINDLGAEYLRVSVVNDKYKLDLDPNKNDGDDVLAVHEGIPIISDRASIPLNPHGIVIDYIDEPGQRGFQFVSPELTKVPESTQTLAEARQGFQTRVVRDRSKSYPAPVPPKGVLSITHYPAPAGMSVAYLSRSKRWQETPGNCLDQRRRL
jgi:Fe-S cluster assembly iron-binding protein IscA